MQDEICLSVLCELECRPPIVKRCSKLGHPKVTASTSDRVHFVVTCDQNRLPNLCKTNWSVKLFLLLKITVRSLIHVYLYWQKQTQSWSASESYNFKNEDKSIKRGEGQQKHLPGSFPRVIQDCILHSCRKEWKKLEGYRKKKRGRGDP